MQVEYPFSTAYTDTLESTASFYSDFTPSVFSPFDPATVSFENAYVLYEYAQYAYLHNATVFNALLESDIATFYTLASEQQFALNAYNVSNGGMNAIAGATLASEVIQQFSHTIASNGVSDKLTLLFGSYEPFLSFFSLSGLSAMDNGENGFSSLPLHGSVMAFELFSYADATPGLNLTAPFPSTDDLWVRFLFRNGTDETAPLISYPLFGRGNSRTDMSWSDFMAGMGNVVDGDGGVADWCNSCQSVNLFCEAIALDTYNSSTGAINLGKNSKGLQPAIAGVIGATVTLAAFIIFGAALALFGFRLDYHEGRKGAFGGGFKGREKMASDADLTIGKGGAGATVARHERVGSWELHDSPDGNAKHGSLDKEIETGRVVSGADYGRKSEDGIDEANPFGEGVKPVDQV